ncbi:glycosyltransferase 87 family protein [Thermodesulfobacteriota bacterium]
MHQTPLWPVVLDHRVPQNYTSPMGPIPRSWLLLGGTGILLAILLVALSVISPDLAVERISESAPILTSVLILMAAGSLYLALIFLLKKIHFAKEHLFLVILLGLVMRLTMFGSTPILEDDHYRYLWDGAVLANGFNPYRYSPQEIRNGDPDHIPDRLRQMAAEAGHITEHINYPWLRTIYPPLTQVAFALAHIITPWSLTGWRILLLLLDGLTFYLLYLLLTRLHLPLSFLMIYWWNPLLIKEIYNSGHMEMVLLPLLLASLLFTIREKYLIASAALGLAVGAKFWPVLLIPVVWRPLLKDLKHLVPAFFIFTGLAVAMFLPIFLSGLDYHSGFAAYGKYWEMNDALFMLILWGVQMGLDVFQLNGANAQEVTRIVVSVILVLCILWAVRRPHEAPLEIGRRFLFVISALFLLSPTQFPWYSLWMLPFLSILPRLSLLLLTPLLSLYYIRYYFQAKGMVHIHDHGIVWLEFVPVWCLLMWEWIKQRPREKSNCI